MKKFPSNPENFNPVQLLHQMSPGIKFKETTISSIIPSLFEASCDINNATFMGQGNILLKIFRVFFILYSAQYFLY